MRNPALAICPLMLCLTGGAVRAAEWLPVTPSELALKQPKADPHADAEALFRDVRILNEQPSFGYARDTRTEYIRLKIFTQRGKDEYGNVEIPYSGDTNISGVEGRTIRPDGTAIPLKSDAIFHKTILKKSGIRVKVVSFALPDVEPGDVIEYRWHENLGDVLFRYIPLQVQSAFPTEVLTFHIKSESGQWVTLPELHDLAFHCKIDNWQRESSGFVKITLHNIPGFHKEPYMPPDDSMKQWILLYYAENGNAGRSATKYWNDLGRKVYRNYHQRIKVNNEVRNIAAQAVAGASSDDEKLKRLVEYCRKNLKDIHGSQITLKQREQAKQEWNTADILRQQSGTEDDIRLAFIALAKAAGFQAQLAEMCRRDVFFFNPNATSAYFLNAKAVAVKLNGAWKFYDVTNRAVAPGELPWRLQDVKALVMDPKTPEFVTTPMLGVKQTMIQRGATFQLSADGTLEGVAREILWGNAAAHWRQRFGLKNEAEREAALRQELKQRFSDFDISNIRFGDSPDDSKPVGISYHIVVRNYAQHTGKHIFLIPAYFETGDAARFMDTARRYPIYFDYPWSESDSVEIQLPDGYHLDHADSPSPLQFPPTGSYSAKMYITKSNKLLYERRLVFGADSGILFPATAYSSLKTVFDRIHADDGHIVALKAELLNSAQTR